MLASEMPGFVVVVAPAAVVDVAADDPAEEADVVAEPAAGDDALLSLPHDASRARAAVAASTGASRRRLVFTNPPGSDRGVLGAVPAQRDALEGADQHDG